MVRSAGQLRSAAQRVYHAGVIPFSNHHGCPQVLGGFNLAVQHSFSPAALGNILGQAVPSALLLVALLAFERRELILQLELRRAKWSIVDYNLPVIYFFLRQPHDRSSNLHQ